MIRVTDLTTYRQERSIRRVNPHRKRSAWHVSLQFEGRDIGVMTLTDVEIRILGSLIEKESVTPDNYPLSLNALTAACNQLSNREPVMELDEDQVKYAVNSLRQQSLVRAIQPSDSRVMKFQHLATDKWGLEPDTRAVLCVLMLRGPQTLGEIKGRTGRLASFPGIADVERAMSALVSMQLAVQLPRRPGQKEARYAHLLSGEPMVEESQPAEGGRTNTEIARAYLKAIEDDAAFDVLSRFFADDVVQHEYPNQLVKTGATRTLADLKAAAERGKGVVEWQKYEVRNAIEAGDWVALEVTWRAALKVPVGSLPAGGEMKANFGVFLQFRDGRIVKQHNYDCFDPF
jgi:uncharacterized protein